MTQGPPFEGEMHQGQPYWQQHGGQVPGPPGPPGPPRPTGGRAPKVLCFLGGGLLVAAVALIVMAVMAFMSTVPTGVLDDGGRPGPAALMSGEPPLEAEVRLEAGESYMLYVAGPDELGTPWLEEAPKITPPGGEAQPMGRAEVSSTAGSGGFTAVGVGSWRAEDTGVHTVSASGFADPWHHERGEAYVVLAAGGDFGGLMGGVFMTLGGVFGGAVLGFVGLTLLIIGIVLGTVRRRRRRPGHLM